MGSYRKVGDDILKEWLDFREEELGSLTSKELYKPFFFTNTMVKISENSIRYVFCMVQGVYEEYSTCIIGTLAEVQSQQQAEFGFQLHRPHPGCF